MIKNLILHHFWFMFIGNGDNKDPDSGGQKENPIDWKYCYLSWKPKKGMKIEQTGRLKS